MSNLAACIFPDNALLDKAFVNSTLIYFDNLIVPGLPFTGPEWIKYQLQLYPDQYDEHRRFLGFLDLLDDLESKGIVTQADPLVMGYEDISKIVSVLISRLSSAESKNISNLIDASEITIGLGMY